MAQDYKYLDLDSVSGEPVQAALYGAVKEQQPDGRSFSDIRIAFEMPTLYYGEDVGESGRITAGQHGDQM